MKKTLFKSLLFVLLAMVCTCSFGMISPETVPPIGNLFTSDYSILMATAPIAAIPFVAPENLKIPQMEFQNLINKHGNLYVIDIQIDETEEYQFIVCRPTRTLITMIANNQNDLEKVNDLIIKNMVVGGDINALEDGLVYSNLIQQISPIMQQGSGFLSRASTGQGKV